MEKLINIVKKINNYLDKSRVNVPILNNLKLVNNEYKNIIFVAIGRGIVQQFLCDGDISESETIENRIDSINSSLDNCTFCFYKDYKKIFDYKIYIQDIKTDTNTFIKQMSAYFIDDNRLYQLSVAIGPYVVENGNNEIVKTNLFNTLKDILDGIDYIEGVRGIDNE